MSGSEHIILRYEVSLDYLPIALPTEKALGPHVLIRPPVFTPGDRTVSLRDIQEFRGNITHNGREITIFGGFFRNMRFASYPFQTSQTHGSDAINGMSGIAFCP